MDADRYRRAGEIFDAALERPTEQRQSFLERACATDLALREEVERLLEHDHQTAGLLDRSPIQLTPEDLAGPHRLAAGTRLGNYRVSHVIGQGGMGVVYLASRDDDEFQRQVAIKVGRDREIQAQGSWRFHRERQILARLEHPNIARLYDGGTTEDGQPYLVLEYVDGLPIHTYCDQQRLPIAQRLELIIKVCSAVQFAHRNLVVHRDLKPSNILVDDHGEPKLLDFGIAKLLTSDSANDGLQTTRDHQRILTLFHASPEQILGQPITTASDVYCLGLVLYELLCGISPFAEDSPTSYERFRNASEFEPPRPSQTLGQGASAPGQEGLVSIAKAMEIAQLRSTSLAGLRKALRGDLDIILEKALRREPEQRYATANELAEDLSRHLQNRPITAGAPGTGYRLRKFLRRHRAPVLVAAISTSLIVGLVIAFIFTLMAQVDRTARERQKAERLVTFLTETFAVTNPDQTVGETVTARELLDSGAQRIATELQGEPEVQAMMLDAMGQIYHQIGLLEPARELLQQALQQRLTRIETPPADLVESLTHVGSVQAAAGQVTAARATLEDAIAKGRELPARDGLIFARSLEALALLERHQYDFDNSEDLYREALALRQKSPLADPPGLAKLHSEYSVLLYEQGRFDEAREQHQKSLDIRRSHFGEHHPRVAESLQDLARLEHFLGRLDEAEALHRQALELEIGVHGEKHKTVADGKNSLALVVGDLGRNAEAVELLREAIEITHQLSGKTTEYAAMVSNLAVHLTSLNQFEEAEALFLEALKIRTHFLGDRHPYVGQTFLTLGRVYQRQGQLDRAENHFVRAAAIAQNLPPGHRAIAYPSLALANLQLERGKGAEAENLLRQALEELPRSHAPGHSRIAMATAYLGRSLQMQGRLEEAEGCLLQALELLEAAPSDDPARKQQVLGWLADNYQQSGKHQEEAQVRARLQDHYDAG